MSQTIDQLRVICAVARCSSFSDAARELLLTQPAITRTVRSVELGLGLALFSRTTRRVQLTADGAEFVAVALEILEAYDRGLERFGAWRRAEVGTVTALALPSLAAGVLAPIVAEFLGARPGVRLEILTANAEDILDRLRAGEGQLAITEDPGQHTDLDVVSLARDVVFAVVPAAHPVAEATSVTWAELTDYPFITLNEGTSVRRLTDAGFGAAGVSPPTTLSADTIGTVSALIAEGIGISAFPNSTRPLVTTSDIRFVRLAGPVISRSLTVVAARAPRPTPLVVELRNAIVAGWNADDS